MEQYLRAFVFEQPTGYKLKKVIWVIDINGRISSPYGNKRDWGVDGGFKYVYLMCLSHQIEEAQVKTLISGYKFQEAVTGRGSKYYWIDFGDGITGWGTKFPELLD